MRRFIVLVITALAGLVLFPANPAHAGGPTSVLVVDHDGRHAAGALTGSSAYDSLARALDIENPPNGLLGAEPFVSSFASLMTSIVPRYRYSLGVFGRGSRQRVDRRHDLAGEELDRGRVDRKSVV